MSPMVSMTTVMPAASIMSMTIMVPAASVVSVILLPNDNMQVLTTSIKTRGWLLMTMREMIMMMVIVMMRLLVMVVMEVLLIVSIEINYHTWWRIMMTIVVRELVVNVMIRMAVSSTILVIRNVAISHFRF